MSKNSEQKSTRLSSAFRQSNASSVSVSQPRIKIGLYLIFALSLLAGCATTPKADNMGLRFLSGKAQVFDKNKNKVEWVYFSSAVRAPNQLRLDVSMGLLGIPLGTLVLNGNEATLVSIFERKVYVTKQGDKVLEKLLKTAISPTDITAIFAENLPLGGTWSCTGGDSSQTCKQSDVQLDWSKLEKNDRKMVIDSPRSKVTFMYQPARSGQDSFEVTYPKDFKVIEL